MFANLLQTMTGGAMLCEYQLAALVIADELRCMAVLREYLRAACRRSVREQLRGLFADGRIAMGQQLLPQPCIDFAGRDIF
jgi:hypothetical protein